MDPLTISLIILFVSTLNLLTGTIFHIIAMRQRNTQIELNTKGKKKKKK